jgi:predicted metal-dependent hydrolase
MMSKRKRHNPKQDLWTSTDEVRWAAKHWAARIGVKLCQIHVRDMRSKWASMSTAGRLTLNTDLLCVTKDLGEFVIIHELVHLLVPNHSGLFKSYMRAYCPDWERRDRELQSINLY